MATTARPVTSKKVVSPESAGSSPLDKALRVEKEVVDELLLVCGVIGTTVDDQHRIVPVTDCLNWLQDLQRVIRRDEDLYRPISLLLGAWKIVETKLLPLVLSCRYDNAMVLTICKILVILTKPLAENTQRSGRMVINARKMGKNKNGGLLREQQKLRQNAIAQAEQLVEYKRVICHYNAVAQGTEGGILSIFVSLLAEPLAKTNRTDADHLTIELVLHLFRNLLAAEPLVYSSADAHYKVQTLHFEMVSLLEKELVLDILIVLAADIESRANAQYNLLLMELLQHLIKYQDPTAVALCHEQRPSTITTSGLLKQQLERQQDKTRALISSRHAHFGGTLVRQRGDGNKEYVGTSALEGNQKTTLATTSHRKQAFVGANRGLLQHNRQQDAGGPAKTKSRVVLDNFMRRFMIECYGPTMKSLKNEFRRDSVRLEDGDRHVFFRIVWFCCQWWRNGRRELDPEATSSIGHLIFTMDLFSFNLVLNATDTFAQFKKHAHLAQSVALLGEMMHLLYIMYTSKESTEQIMAMGLMDHLFYGSEPIDRVPKLVSLWQPATFSREFLCDLVELVHVQLKLLDLHVKNCTGVPDATSNSAKADTVIQMKAKASEFDVPTYFLRRIVSNNSVAMYTHLFSQYATNAELVNHRVVTFLTRMCKHKVVVEEQLDDPDLPKNLLAQKTVTLEPMLYNIQLITTLNLILNDKWIRSEKGYKGLLNFCAGLVHRFSHALSANPLLMAEMFFKHPHPHRYCELVANIYVDDEMRMIAQKRLLQNEQAKFDEQLARIRNQKDDSDSDDDEHEVEMEDYGVTERTELLPKKKAKTKLRKIAGRKRKFPVDSDSDDGDASESDNEDKTKDGHASEVGDEPAAPSASAEDEQPSRKPTLSTSNSEDSDSDDDDMFSAKRAAVSDRHKSLMERIAKFQEPPRSDASDADVEPAPKKALEDDSDHE